MSEEKTFCKASRTQRVKTIDALSDKDHEKSIMNGVEPSKAVSSTDAFSSLPGKTIFVLRPTGRPVKGINFETDGPTDKSQISKKKLRRPNERLSELFHPLRILCAYANIREERRCFNQPNQRTRLFALLETSLTRQDRLNVLNSVANLNDTFAPAPTK